MGPRDGPNDLILAYQADPAPVKVSLAVGVYRDDEGKPFTFSSVREAERLLADDQSLSHDYLLLEGYKDFNSLALSLLLGEDCEAVQQGRVASFGTLSGAGALRMGAELMKKVLAPNVPKPSKLGTVPVHFQNSRSPHRRLPLLLLRQLSNRLRSYVRRTEHS